MEGVTIFVSEKPQNLTDGNILQQHMPPQEKKYGNIYTNLEKYLTKQLSICNKIPLSFVARSKMSGKSFFVLFFFCLLCPHTFSQSLSHGQSCNNAGIIKTSLSTNSNEPNIHRLMQALNHPTVKNIMDFCEGAHPLPTEQMNCLKDQSSDSSLVLDENIQIFLLHIGEWFSSLNEIKATYNKEKEACPDYYSYGGLGYCIFYTGRKCWDEAATTAVITHVFSFGSYYQVREFLTPPDEEGTVHLRKERKEGATYYHHYQPAIIRVFKK